MKSIEPATRTEFVTTLADLASREKLIVLEGNSTRMRMGGPVPDTDFRLSTRCLNRVLQYQPEDLTISVEAGMLWTELCKLLAEHNQMLPLDPPNGEQGTVGGVLAADCSGPRRLLYGTARDMVIGMEFATLEGKAVQSGGMVVKNVAGLDTGKLMIGSFGTLAAITVANFKLSPQPRVSATFLIKGEGSAAIGERRDRIRRSGLQPAALEILNPLASKRFDTEGWMLAMQAVGNEAAVKRCRNELSPDSVLEGEDEDVFWRGVQEFSSRWMDANPGGAVVRVQALIQQLPHVLRDALVPALFRAGSGLAYLHFDRAQTAGEWLTGYCRKGGKGVIEASPVDLKPHLPLWPAPGDDLGVMQQLKKLFDPKGVLNLGRLYGRI